MKLEYNTLKTIIIQMRKGFRVKKEYRATLFVECHVAVELVRR